MGILYSANYGWAPAVRGWMAVNSCTLTWRTVIASLLSLIDVSRTDAWDGSGLVLYIGWQAGCAALAPGFSVGLKSAGIENIAPHYIRCMREIVRYPLSCLSACHDFCWPFFRWHWGSTSFGVSQTVYGDTFERRALSEGEIGTASWRVISLLAHDKRL